MALSAYQNAATRAEDPRSTEYRLFAQVTRALIKAAEADLLDMKTRSEALDWNRRVWSAFAIDCAEPDNKLPEGLRAAIISLSIFVSKHSSAVMREGADIDILIEINKTIMQGLQPQSQPAPQPVAG
ncbi:flagellar biosynthesis regulator FlaF [Hyphobacterium indicum]|uniref:flagellar biosynthesis regulator FlaF n=1 Tax=Hyphobacterium indicum TaxID=2162714 RepID=UPI000D64EBA0|nr:flagellar biosynthesis regulator FlaF [Hyphobacterium indicum]